MSLQCFECYEYIFENDMFETKDDEQVICIDCQKKINEIMEKEKKSKWE